MSDADQPRADAIAALDRSLIAALAPADPMTPCTGCGSTEPASHVYGVRTCCPDCEHPAPADPTADLRAALTDAEWAEVVDVVTSFGSSLVADRLAAALAAESPERPA